MTRLGRITSGLVAFAALLGIVVGVPWALVRYVGWPLPHALPAWGQFAAALTQRGIPNRVLIDVLAVLVWLSWATLAAALAVELPASARGHNARHIRGLGPAQTVAAHLVAAVIVGALAAMPQPAPAAHPTPLAASLTIDQPQPWAVPFTLAPPAASDASPRSPTVGSGEPPSASRYLVQRGDTLWSIAQTQLGDPLRWRDIYTLNHDRAQPDGRTLDSPHWIYPGWTLLLPAQAAAPVPDETPVPPPATAPVPALPQQTPPPLTPSASTLTPTAPLSNGDPVGHHSLHAPAWVDLPSGSRIGGGFLAGVLAALATERLRRRRHYRPSPPAPSPTVASSGGRPQSDGLRALLTTLHAGGDDQTPPPPAHNVVAAPLTATPADDARLRPDRIEVGGRGDHRVQLSLCQWPNLTVTGDGAEATARAWLAALLTRAGPYAAQLLMPTSLATRLLPDLALPGLITVDDVAVAVSRLEAERVGRVRTLEDADFRDVVSYREHNPEDPLPVLLAVVDDLPADLSSRWAAATRDAARLGIASLIVAHDGDCPHEPRDACLRITAAGTIEHATPVELADLLDGVRVYQLLHDDITDLLAPIAAIHAGDDPEPVSPYPDLDTASEPASAPAAAQTPVRPSAWPAPTPNAKQPIRVRLLGPAHIDAWDQPVTTGLRASAYELLAYYLLHPDGATAEAAIDAIWPDVDLDRGRQRFWTALGNLRSRLRGPNGESLDVITKSGPRYRPDAAVLDVDLWRFEAALAEAATASTPDAAIDALRRAVTAYTADFCADAYYLWAEADREDIHRRALDAHIRLAELLADTGSPQPAISTLEAAVRHDPVCEEAYRRLIAAYADAGHRDAATRSWQMLQGRLAELDAEPTPETIRVVERVLGGHRHRSGGVVV